MPCWPDLWVHFKRLLPLISIVCLFAAYIVLISLLLWAPRLRKRWLRIAYRIVGAIAVIPLFIVLPPMLLGFMFASGNPPTQSRIVRSQNGQEATVNYSAGFLGRDYTEVTLKKPDCCQHSVVFWHAGPSWFDDMKIEWPDDDQLRLTYHARSGDPQHCEQHVGDINVICNSLAFGSN